MKVEMLRNLNHSLPRPPTLDTSRDFDEATKRGALAVNGVDFCIATNGQEHHTQKYSLMTRDVDKCLVIRRGQAFKLKILLNRPFDIKNDGLSLIFLVADEQRRSPSNNLIVNVPLLEKESENLKAWHAVYEGQTDSQLLVSVTPAADCVVAAWQLEIDTKTYRGSAFSYTHRLPIYVLFNPWCNNDSVFMADESHRQEYVQEDGGIIFRGVYNVIKPAPWHYAQYDRDILECALHLVRNVGAVHGRTRRDPIQTVRGLSAAINEQDDDGVLSGNWGQELSDYEGGTHPFKWIGSLAILQKYYKTKKPVKWAQCWVYAGVLTTICRALGIPCRPVTAFNAAHDSEGSLTIDCLTDENGKVRGRDSIWNYHVWNEVWMERPDLGAEYSGWQIIDSTPQEASEGKYRCGPAPLKAVHDGEVQLPYDVPYVFAEVNADQVTWKYFGKTQPLKLLSRDTTYVGQNISTKAVGALEREDLTSQYKFPEGTRQERDTMEKALRMSEKFATRYYLNEAFNEVQFDFELRDDIVIGQDFDVVLHVKNHSSVNSHRVNGTLIVNTVTQIGWTGDNVKQQEFDLNLEPEGKRNIILLVTFDDYYKKLVDQASFSIACVANLPERNFDYFAKDDFRVRNPDIKMRCDDQPVAGRELTVFAQFKNPLPISLTNGKFYIQGPGFETQLKIKLEESVASGATASAQFQLTPPWRGRHQISAKFSSKELHDVDGSLLLTVAYEDNSPSPTRSLESISFPNTETFWPDSATGRYLPSLYFPN